MDIVDWAILSSFDEPELDLFVSLDFLLSLPFDKESASTIKENLPRRFVEERLIRAVQYASICYCSDFLIKEWRCGPKCHGPCDGSVFMLYFQSASTQVKGYMVAQPSRSSIVIGFGGSLDIRNWFYNAKFYSTLLRWKDSPRDTLVHKGFLESYDSVRQDILHALRSAINKYPTYDIEVVGHSLGGALAVLCALDIKVHLLPLLDPHSQNPHKVLVTTLGQPRVGNSVFVKYYSTYFHEPLDTIRIVNDSDVIPKLPPRFLGYRHSIQEAWIVSDEETRLCSSVFPEDPACSSSISYFQSSWSDHIFAYNITMELFCQS